MVSEEWMNHFDVLPSPIWLYDSSTVPCTQELCPSAVKHHFSYFPQRYKPASLVFSTDCSFYSGILLPDD